MILHFGTSTKRVPIGYVATCCEKCRDMVATRVIEIQEYWHLYYVVQVTRPKPIDHCGVCCRCGSHQDILIKKFNSIARTAPDDMHAFTQLTNPGLPERFAQWMDLQARAETDDLSDAERMSLIVRTMTKHATRVAMRGAEAHIDIWTGLTGLLSLAASGGVAYLWYRLHPASWVMPTMLLGLVATWIVPIYFLMTDLRRHVRRRIMPRIATDLAQLNPMCDEIEIAITAMRDQKLKLGALLDKQLLADAVVKAMSKTEQRL